VEEVHYGNAGNGLRVGQVDGFSSAKIGVELVGDCHRADVDAAAAGDTLGYIHAAWLGVQASAEVAEMAGEAGDFG